MHQQLRVNPTPVSVRAGLLCRCEVCPPSMDLHPTGSRREVSHSLLDRALDREQCTCLATRPLLSLCLRSASKHGRSASFLLLCYLAFSCTVYALPRVTLAGSRPPRPLILIHGNSNEADLLYKEDHELVTKTLRRRSIPIEKFMRAPREPKAKWADRVRTQKRADLRLEQLLLLFNKTYLGSLNRNIAEHDKIVRRLEQLELSIDTGQARMERQYGQSRSSSIGDTRDSKGGEGQSRRGRQNRQSGEIQALEQSHSFQHLLDDLDRQDQLVGKLEQARADRAAAERTLQERKEDLREIATFYRSVIDDLSAAPESLDARELWRLYACYGITLWLMGDRGWSDAIQQAAAFMWAPPGVFPVDDLTKSVRWIWKQAEATLPAPKAPANVFFHDLSDEHQLVIDGIELASIESWRGVLPPGLHYFEVRGQTSHDTLLIERVRVTSGQELDYPVPPISKCRDWRHVRLAMGNAFTTGQIPILVDRCLASYRKSIHFVQVAHHDLHGADAYDDGDLIRHLYYRPEMPVGRRLSEIPFEEEPPAVRAYMGVAAGFFAGDIPGYVGEAGVRIESRRFPRLFCDARASLHLSGDGELWVQPGYHTRVVPEAATSLGVHISSGALRPYLSGGAFVLPRLDYGAHTRIGLVLHRDGWAFDFFVQPRIGLLGRSGSAGVAISRPSF